MDENLAPCDYDDGNRAFLQSFMARGTMTLAEGKDLLAAIFSVQEGKTVTADQVTTQDFNSYLSTAADALSPFDYEIRRTHHQVTKEQVYAFVNSVSDPLTQLATQRSSEEMQYIKRLLDAIFESNNTRRREVMAIRAMQALEGQIRKGNDDKGLKQTEVERLLAALETEKWLERSHAGFYSLAPRALLELRAWLLETYNDADHADDWQRIKFCEACKEIITVGQRCANFQCNVRMHDICANAYWNSRPSKHCTRCQAVWDGEHFVGEKVVTKTEAYLKERRRSAGVAGVKRPPSTQVVAGDEDKEIHNDEFRAGARTSKRRRGSTRIPDEDEEEKDKEEADDDLG